MKEYLKQIFKYKSRVSVNSSFPFETLVERMQIKCGRGIYIFLETVGGALYSTNFQCCKKSK